MKRWLAIALTASILAAYSFAQNAPVVGLPPFASMQNGGFDRVNLGNLNVNFGLPVVHMNGRSLPLDFSIGYNSLIWQITGTAPSKAWTPAGQKDATGAYTFGWIRDLPLGTTTYSRSQSSSKCYDGSGGYWMAPRYTYGNFQYTDTLGTSHRFSSVTYIYNSCTDTSSGTWTGYADDNSGFYIDVTSSGQYPTHTVTHPSGITITGQITDTNGNYISSSANTSGTCPTCKVTNTITDTLGNPSLIITSDATTTPPSTSYQYLYPNGSTYQSITLAYAPYNIKTNFGCSGIAEYNGTANLPTSLSYPDGTSYSFAYEPTPGNSGYTTGRLSQVTLPTGGQINYNYTFQSTTDGIVCADGSGSSLQRQIVDGTNNGTWTYSRSLVSGSTWLTQVTDPTAAYPNGNLTKIYFQAVNGFFYESERDLYQGQSTWLESIYTCYNGSPAPCSNTAVSLPITRRIVTLKLASGMESKTDTFYDSTGFGLTREVDEYDYGNPSPGELLRATLTTYVSLTGIIDHPATVTVKDGSGNIKAQTTFTYSDSVTSTSGTPNHKAVTTSRGNATSVQDLVGGSTLTRSYSYFDTGNVNVATDVNGAQTLYSYGACGNSFATLISLPVNSMTRQMAWSCVGGVQISSTDENSRQTSYSYDNSLRLTAINYPDGGQISYGYHLTSSPPNIATSQNIDASRSLTTTTVLDGLGRVSQQQLNSDPVGTIYTDTTYDAIGRIVAVSNPYRANDTVYTTQYAYDALGRPTTITNPDASTVQTTYSGRAAKISDEGNGTRSVQRVNQWDGLGRLISVCEVTSVTQLGITPTPIACGLDLAANGFLTSYQYDTLNNLTSVSQGGLASRSYSYDDLSRLTSESNPESGTTTYTYNSNGDLYQRTQPKPNQTNPAVTVTTTHSFDALHRLTQKSYSDGTTPTVNYVYDTNSYWGYTSLPDTAGRRVAATTTAGGISIGSVFGYDPMGRVNLVHQRTPVNNGAGAFDIAYTYDYLGDILTATNGEGVTFSYSYDTAANLSSASSSLSDANHPGTLLTVLTRNALGQMATGTLGNGIALSRSYTNRGFLQSLSDGSVYTVNPLSYAANGSILGATDSINGTWTFSYDDFNRMASASKTGDSYTYAYDRFGNRWQQNGGIRQSSLSFDQYNHIAVGNGVIYDAAGNVTDDGFHSYTYDAENRLATVDGSYVYLYDADGQRMRQGTTSGTYDYLYDLQGRVVTAVSSGNQWVRGEIYAGPAHVATYADGTTYFDHSDWLGTVRARTGPTGTAVQTCTTEWFGEQVCTGTDGSTLHFTGHELDYESNLNHFLYRQYSSAQGRWVTPDPAGLSAASSGTPQTWNRYTYVGNSPMNAVDPLGLDFSMNWCPFFPGCDSGPGIGDGGGLYGRFSSLILRAILQDLIANALAQQSSATVIKTSAGAQRVGSESLGLPAGMKLPQPTLASIPLPGNMQCEFGVCGTIGDGFTSGVTCRILCEVEHNVRTQIAALAGLTLSFLLKAASSIPHTQSQTQTQTPTSDLQGCILNFEFELPSGAKSCAYKCKGWPAANVTTTCQAHQKCRAIIPVGVVVNPQTACE